MSASISTLRSPSEQLAQRLDDPVVVNSLVSLLDNAELLSTLVVGLSKFMERGDTIVESLSEGVKELTAGQTGDFGKSLADAKTAMSKVNEVMPVVQELIDSGMFNSDVVALLSMMSDAAVEGAATARTSATTVKGVRGAMKVMKDPEVQRGLGLMVEIAKSLGRHMARS